MERRLIVMRHARSATGSASTSDHERPLVEKGKREATEISERLVELGWIPQVVLSSDANRTRQTWETMAGAFKKSPEVIWDENLYLAGADAMENALSALPDDVTDVLLLGHNPGWQNAISYFAGRQERMTPANAALLHGQGDTWEEAAVCGGFELVQVLRPHSL